MSLASSIFARLSGVAGVTALIGAGNAARAYPGVAPQGVAAPYVVWNVISSDANATHDASSDQDLALVQFSCVANTYKAARQLRAAVRAALSDVALAGGEKAVDFDERDGFSEEPEQHVQLLEADIWHNPLAA